MSGQEPTRRATAGSKGGKKRAGARTEEPDTPALRPLVLTPSPADLAAGWRVIVAEEHEIPRSAKAFFNRAVAAGWSAQVTYSYFWDTPPYTGRWAGRWVPKHSICVRVWHLGRRLRAYALWTCIDDGSGAASWDTQGGQAQLLGSDAPGWPTPRVGVTDLDKMIKGELTVKWGPVRAETDKKGRAMIHYGYFLG